MYAHLTSIVNAIISCWILLNISTSNCVHIVTYIYVINLLYNISFTNLMGQNSAYITLIPSTPLKSFKSRQLTNHDKLEDFPSGSKPDAADQSFVLCVSMCVCVDSFDSRVEFIAQDGAPFSGLLFANMFVQQLFLGAHAARQWWRLNGEARNAAGSTDQSLCRSGGPDESLTDLVGLGPAEKSRCKFWETFRGGFCARWLGFLACVWTFGLIGHRLGLGEQPTALCWVYVVYPCRPWGCHRTQGASSCSWTRTRRKWIIYL